MVLYEEQVRVGESEMSLYISYFFEFWIGCVYYSIIKGKDREREIQVHSSAYRRGRRVVERDQRSCRVTRSGRKFSG